MLIQANRLTAAFAAPSNTQVRAQRAVAPAANAGNAVATDTVTISKAARELLAATSQTPATYGMAKTPAVNGISALDAMSAPANSTGDYQAAVRKAIDNLQAAYNNKQMSDIQFKHDMAFYSRMAIVA